MIRHAVRLTTAAWLLAGVVALAVAAAGASLADSPPASTTPDVTWTYDAKGRCDPFVPLVRDGRVVPCDAQSGGAGGQGLVPQLAGILWDAGGRSIALINGGEMRVGDEVNGFQVAEITRDEVVLVRDEERVVLRISFDTPKPPADGEKPVKPVKPEKSKGGGRP